MSQEAQDMREESLFGDDTAGADDSVRENVARLIASGQELIGAELEWAKLKAALMARGARNLALFGALALVLLLAGLTTLFVGIIIALAPLVGAALAALIVGGAALVLALLFGLAARRAARLIDPRSKAP